VDAATAQALAEKLWRTIQFRQNSSGITLSRPGHPSGTRGMLDYYRGLHRLRFASPQFAESWNKRYTGFNDNWCAPVVDAAAERINHVGIRLGEDEQGADTEFQRIIEANDGDRGFSELVTVALAASRSYALVWGNPDDDNTPLVTWEHPDFCAIAKDPETRRTTASAKGWFEEDGQGCLTLYTDDEVWKWNWAIPNNQTTDPQKGLIWTPREVAGETWPLRNPLGRNPMIEFANNSLLDDKPMSDIAGVAAMQDAINLIWGYLLNALDFASLPQRVVTGTDIPQTPVLDGEGQIIGTRPVSLKDLKDDRLLWLTSDTAKIDSWPAANLEVFSKVIDMAVDHVAAQTRTPPHYLIGKMSNVAGDAFTASETGLVARCIQDIKNFTRPTRDLYVNIALAMGNPDLAKKASVGKVLWADPQYRALSQKTDAFVKLRQSGMPMEYLLEWYGLEPREVARVLGMIESEQAAALSAAAANAAFAAPPGAAPYGIIPPNLP
jgi:hypothetical protein